METRDKLFTEEQYLKQLKMYDEDISYYEQMHLSGKHIGYDSLFNYRLRYLLVQYSMGQDIDKLKNNYVKALKTMPRFWTDNGLYIEMLWLLSIGIMLDYEDDHRLSTQRLATFYSGRFPSTRLRTVHTGLPVHGSPPSHSV